MHPLQKQGLYPILDLDLCESRGMDPVLLVSLWFSEGIRFFQLRAKGRNRSSCIALAKQIREAFPAMGIIANDDWEAALGNRDLFAGLHVGQGDLVSMGPEGRERLYRASHESVAGELPFITGVSTHNLQEMWRVAGSLPGWPDDIAAAFTDPPDLQGKAATIRWSYIALGPFFKTVSKREDLSPVLTPEDLAPLFRTLEGLCNQSGQKASVPFPVFIGGITQERMEPLLESLSTYSGLKPAIAVIGAGMSLLELRGIRGHLQY